MKTLWLVTTVTASLILSGCDRPPAPSAPPSKPPQAAGKSGEAAKAAKAAKSARDAEAVKAMMAEVDKRPVPASPKANRAEWLRAIAVGAYDTTGERNPAWDTPARAALAAFAEFNATTTGDALPLQRRLSDAARQAVAAGCTDPLVGYLNLRFNPVERAVGAPGYAAKYAQVAEQMMWSKYHPLRTLYVCLRAADAFDATDRARREMLPEASRLRSNAVGCLHHALKDANLPPEEAYLACAEIMQTFKRSPGPFEVFFLAQEPVLHRHWPKSHFPHVIMGDFWINHAWNARGRGFADTVSDAGWKLFEERLGKAEQELGTAWKLNPGDERVPRLMLTVELGQGQGRARMEQWFERAMKINPASFSACSAKLLYLEPKWHGSPEALLAFGRECTTSKVWKGSVPLILAEAHERLANYLKDPAEKAAYWKQPAVWADIERAYQRFFELNPEAVSYHHNFARYALRCEQWKTLRAQLNLLGEINHDYFGGKAEFDRIVKLAEAKGGE